MSTPKAAVFPTRSYQSEDAAKKAAERAAGTDAVDPNAEAVLGDISASAVAAMPEVRERDDEMRPVKVRSRVTIEPFRYGNRMYTIAKNKETVIPLCVRNHLEEKGLL